MGLPSRLKSKLAMSRNGICERKSGHDSCESKTFARPHAHDIYNLVACVFFYRSDSLFQDYRYKHIQTYLSILDEQNFALIDHDRDLFRKQEDHSFARPFPFSINAMSSNNAPTQVVAISYST